MAIIRKIPWTHQPPAFVSQTNESIGDGLIGLFNFNDANCIFHNAAKIKSSVTPAWPQGIPLTAAGNGGRGVRFNVDTAGTKDYAALLHDDELPLDGVTILYVRRVRDTTNRQLGHFGLLEDAGAGDRIGAHAPWSNGTVYWDHGGFSGDNRLTWAGYSKNVNVLDKFVFRAGTQGMAIFYNGAKEASSANASTRTAVPSGNKSFHLGAGQTETIIYGGDTIDVLCFAVWNRELTDNECIGVTRNEWQTFQPSAQIIPFPSGVVTTAALTGTAIAGGVTEAEIVSGNETVLIDLTNDTWAAAGTGPVGSTADTQALIDGFDSAQSEGTGWNAEVRDKEVTTSIVRTSDTRVTWTITAAGAYDITADETITLTIPAAVLVTSGSDVVADATFDVTAAAASGRIMSSITKFGGLAGMGGIAGQGGGLAG